MRCPDCHGKGKIRFYSGLAHCIKCAGSGKISPKEVERLKLNQAKQDHVCRKVK